MKLRHILLRQKYEAEDVQRWLAQGRDFSELAQKHSICSSAKLGGDLGEVRISQLDPDFAEAARVLKVGELSGIIRTRFGHHLILRQS